MHSGSCTAASIRRSPAPSDLDDLAAQTVEEVCLAFPERAVRLVIGERGLRGRYDPGRIVQVLTNLTRNAIEHSRADTTVTLTVERVEDEGRVSVHNVGEPIPEELRARLFQPFSSGAGAPSSAGNVGLGLYIASEIVRNHGGRIEVESGAESGTTFRVVLPLGTEAESPAPV